MDKAKTKTEKSCATSVLSNLIMRWQTSSETSNRKSAGLTTNYATLSRNPECFPESFTIN